MRKLSYQRVGLLVEASILLGVSCLAVKLAPMRWWSTFLGKQDRSQASALSDDQLPAVRNICSAVSAVVRRSPLRLVCLPQSVARHCMLRRRGIESTLYIGMRPGTPGGMDVHAWTAVGRTVVPAEDVSSYSVVSAFS